MSILSPSDPLNSDESGDRWFPPSPLPDGGNEGFFDENRSQILAGVAGLVALILLGLVALTVLGSGDDETDNLSTLSQSLAATDEQPDDATGESSSGADAGSGDPEAAAADDEATDSSAPTSAPTTAPPTTPAPTTAPPTTAPPTTPAPTTAPPTTAPPTTPAPTTAPPTTAPPTTPAPTTAPPTTAPPTTPAPTTAPPTTAPPTTPAPTTAPPTTAAPGGGGGPVQQQILNLVNAERANAGCGALSLNGQLNAAANAHSEDMYVNNYFDHTGLDGSKPWDRAARAGYGSSFIGENIAAGYGSAEAVMNGWMNSSGHRANILNCGYNHLGVGLSSGGNYWTQLFGGG